MSKRRSKVWKLVTDGSEYYCDMCGEDMTSECGECGHKDEAREKMYSNGSYFLCEECYSLTIKEYYDNQAEA